ncbi:WD40 repeat domain-containing protein [Nostoc sp. DedQUE09]|uniref:WD40 repeat domain-containing protein n=1 Tax=Nostoc sp. DedQUE09 TaxID=3075394 RepID=UPI002AD2F836|nr:WD40 repeat domain-containing protein [Nostoc sp. DedQUE09]MDZ7950489.1 WD40 repeat domain-containing protein [Nostoc sp. DedQUE09]
MNKKHASEENSFLPPLYQSIEQNVERSIIKGGIQSIQGNNNSQSQDNRHFEQTITRAKYLANTATGNAVINIKNYYYREDIKAAPVTSDDTNVDDNLPCPYRGLFHFGPNDAEFFFGRDVFIAELIQATAKRNFIPVLGASGSGKSSVVLAGLIPKLQQQGYWLFTHFRPGSDPFHALAEALVPLYTTGDATVQIAQARALARYFHDDKVTLPDIFSHIQRQHPNHRVLLIADQFEELYTLCNDEKTRTSFLDTLLAGFESSLSSFQSPPVLLATMRADFLGNALSYPAFGDLLQNTDIKIRSMNPSELSQVIVKPAEKVGITFEAGLEERILNDVEDKPGNLPLLEFALTLLWQQRTGKKLTHSAYDAIGNVQGALARYADEIYDKLNATEQEQVRRIFIQLVRPGEGTEDTLRLATKAELGETSWGLVSKIANARLVVTSRNTADQETVEVVHEALIRNWNKLRQWIEIDRSFRAWQERLRVGMQQWNATRRDEGALLRGKPLADAEDWLQKRPEELVAEQEYIKASSGLQEREKDKLSRQRKRIIVGLTGGLAGALGLAAIAGLGWWQATNAATNERIKALVVESQSLLALSHRGYYSNKKDSAPSKDHPPKEREQEEAKRYETFFQEASLRAIEAGRELQHAPGIETGTKYQVLGALQQIIGTKVEQKTFSLPECELAKRGPFSLAWSSDRKTIACVNYDGTVRLWDGETGKKTNVFQGDSEWVDDVQFSPDGKMVASGTVDGTVKLWERATGKEIRSLKGHLSQVSKIRFSPDGQTIAAANYDGTIILWDVATERELKTLPGFSDSGNSKIESIFFSPNGQFIVSCGSIYPSNVIKIWEVSTGKELKTLDVGDDRLSDIYISSNSQTLVYSTSTLNNHSVHYWNILENREIRNIPVPGKTFFGPDERLIAVIDEKKYDFNRGIFDRNDKGLVSLWDTSTGKKVRTNNIFPDIPFQISFSPNGKMIAIKSYSYDRDDPLFANTERKGRVSFWSREGTKLSTIEQLGEIFNPTFSPDGQKVAVASFGDDAKGRHIILNLWDVSTGRLLKTLSDEFVLFSQRGFAVGLGIRFSPDGKVIAAISNSGLAKFFDSSTGAELDLPNINPSRDIDRPPIISRDGKDLITLGTDGSMRRQDRSTGKIIYKLKRWDAVLVSAARISNDNKTITTVNWYGKLQKRELATGQILNTIDLPFHKLASTLEFSPDGREVAAAMSDDTVKIWDATTGKEIATLKEYASQSDSAWLKDELHFSPDGTIVAALGSDYQGLYEKGGKLELWKVSTGKPIQFVEIPSGVKNISFSHTSDELALLKSDNTIQLWKLSTRKLLKTIRPSLNRAALIQFNGNSKILFVLGSNELKMLNIETEREIASFKLPPTSSVKSIHFSADGKTLALGSDETAEFTFLDFNLEDLLERSCNIVHDYLKNHQNVNESARHLCNFSTVR